MPVHSTTCRTNPHRAVETASPVLPPSSPHMPRSEAVTPDHSMPKLTTSITDRRQQNPNTPTTTCTHDSAPHNTTRPQPNPTNTSPSASAQKQFKHPIQAPQDYMHTRSKSGIILPKKHFNLTAKDAISLIPTNYRAALKDPNWYKAMLDEYNALMNQNTWSLVAHLAGANIVTGKWIFCHKYHADGTLSRYKARWVVRGFNQREGVDYGETFSPVIKPATIRLVLSIATSKEWPIHQLDVKNAFLHGTLSETVFSQQPSGFIDSNHPNFVCKLNKSLYGLKQAPRAWFLRFTTFLSKISFAAAKADSSLFIMHQGSHTAYLLLYVDDIVLTASSSTLLKKIIDGLQQEFSMSDLGPLHHFLGIAVTRSQSGLFLSQEQYAEELLDKANMSNCNPCVTPVDTSPKLSSASGQPLDNASEYRSLAGALQYLTLTRPDISYATQQACLFMHSPTEAHFQLLKRILQYIRGTTKHGLMIHKSANSDIVAYSDADWAGCPDTRRSTSGYCVFFGANLISWSSKRQATVSRSSAEAEYRGVANAVAECVWLRQLLKELHLVPQRSTIVFCDNVSAQYLSSNPVQHQRTKHIEIDLHFVREKVFLGEIKVLHVPSALQLADVFTKGLPSSLFKDLHRGIQQRTFHGQIL